MLGESGVFRRIRVSRGLPCVWRSVLLVLVVTLGAASPGHAQSGTDGAIHGVVVDGRGALVPWTHVHLQHAATGMTLDSMAGGDGAFLLAGVPVGEYEVTFEAAGFASLRMDRVSVEVGSVREISPHLQAGAVAIAVTVNAQEGNSGVDQIGSATSGVIAPFEIERLPVDGRRWQTFALLTPAANPDPSGSSLVSFRGVAVTQNSSTVDGASGDQSYGAVPQGSGTEDGREAEDEAQGEFSSPSGRQLSSSASHGRHAGAAYTFSQEAVREFRVSGQNYSALYGHAAGAAISTVSKSGSNEVHGSGFYVVRDSAWAATNPFALATHYNNGSVASGLVKPPDLRQQFGGSLGGPVIHDHLFLFYTFDAQRRSFPAVSSPGYAAFYALTPTQLALLGNRGVRSDQVVSALNYLDSLTGKIPRRSDQTINFAKADWQASQRDSFSLEYNRARSNAPAGTRVSPVVDHGLASVGNGFVDVDAAVARWVWTRRTMSHAVMASWSHDLQYETAPKPLPQEAAIAAGGYAPRVAIGPQGFIFGTATSLGRKAYPDEGREELGDLLEWTHGHHLLQLGADVSFVQDTIDALYNVQGSFHYDSGILHGRAGGLVDWITDYTFSTKSYPNGGCPSIYSAVHDFCFRTFSQSYGNPTVSFGTQEWAGFLEESWSARPGLSLHAGVRYEYELLPLPQQPNPALDAVFGRVAATSSFPEDRNNFGPRVGLAWEPFGNGLGLVRLGYGLFYGRLPGATIRSALINTSLPTSASYLRILPTTITACPQVANQGFGYVCTFTSQPPAAVAETSTSTVFDRRFRLPAVQQANLTLERRIPHGPTASASYLLNLDRQLPNSVDINIAPAETTHIFQIRGGTGHAGLRDGQTFVVPFYTQRIDPSFGPVTDIVSNANASYNALVLEARQRSLHGIEFRVSFTWSKALDFGQSGGATPRTNGQFDPFNIRYDHGLSSLNYPHKMLASAVWEPVLGTERRWLRRAANGWMLAPLLVETSGHNYTYEIFSGSRLPGGHTSINGSGGARYLPTIGRNTLRLPDTVNVDLRLTRTARLGERVLLRANAEAFNLANHVNYSAVTQRAFLRSIPVNGVTPLIFQDAATVATEGLNLLPFGSYTAAATVHAQQRRLQLGVRLEF